VILSIIDDFGMILTSKSIKIHVSKIKSKKKPKKPKKKKTKTKKKSTPLIVDLKSDK
jgi:hypothetical protein